MPPNLPIMKVPNSPSRGVYDSAESYFDIVSRVWVGLTFGEGHEALTPSCRYRDKNEQRDCGRVLWPISSPGNVRCRTSGCQQRAELACSNKYHEQGLCGSCAAVSRNGLCGAPGKSASTDIYDGTINKSNYEGVLFIENFESRKPPLASIHWRSTRRLASPNLVAVVKLCERGEPLGSSFKLLWGEITLHDKSDSRNESNCREQGKMAVQIFEVHQEKLDFKHGEAVAIIDCQTFVPEFLPVLRALEIQHQNGLPFQNGKLLNLSSDSKLEQKHINAVLRLKQ